MMTSSPPPRRGTETERGEPMGIIAWILLGLIAGAIAKAILPGDDPGGIIITTVIGILGALGGAADQPVMPAGPGLGAARVGPVVERPVGPAVAGHRLP